MIRFCARCKQPITEKPVTVLIETQDGTEHFDCFLKSQSDEVKHFTQKELLDLLKSGADPIELLHGHICSENCWHHALLKSGKPLKDVLKEKRAARNS